jgi:aminoglycoside phosphotransferase family enzyme/thymidylate kinase
VEAPGVDELIERLGRPDAYPFPVSEVELRQTHISLVFLAGDRVYKLKKPVDLGFLDYTTLERRRHFVDEEVRLNRRLAPRVYLGVVPITRGPDGTLRIRGEGATVEWAVEMMRLPAPRMFDRMLERGEIDNEALGRLADLLARFHGDAATGAGVDEHGTPAAVAFNVRENFEQTRPFVGPLGGGAPAGLRTFTPALHALLERDAEGFLAQEHTLLERRVAAGRIRDGHGDLHAGHICFAPAGIAIYDCVEFSPRIRCTDVACDLAFLAMDLDLRGYRGFARFLVRRYAELTEDAELEKLLRFYKGYRAIVRAKVLSMTGIGESVPLEQREQARLAAMRYVQLAASYCLPPALLLTCGLPGAGKSTAARQLALPFEAAVVRSDVTRKRLAGLAPGQRSAAEFGGGIYAPDSTARTYASLLERAEQELRAGRTAIVDAAFATRELRAPFAELAGRLGVPLLVVEVTAPEGVVRARLEARGADPREASDADLSVYLRARELYEPPVELSPGQVIAVDSCQPAEELVERLLDRLAARSLSHQGSPPRQRSG